MIFSYRDEKVAFDQSVGFDIEYIVRNSRGGLTSAIPFIQGTKEQPHDVIGGNVQRDNVALEIAVAFAYNLSDLITNTRAVLQAAWGRLPYGYTMEATPSALFPVSQLRHEEAKEFGCDPDYDAKTTNVNDFSCITDTVDPTLRSFGLHVHTGMTPSTCRLHILMSDVVLGLFSAMKDNNMESIRRRELYGKPSCYRIKPYGVEYRTLSNYWASSPRLMEVVYILNAIAYTITANPNFNKDILRKLDIHETSDIILRGDDSAATELFFEHVHQHLDYQTKRRLTDELNYDNYGTLAEEWGLEQPSRIRHSGVPRGYYESIRPDYFKPQGAIT